MQLGIVRYIKIVNKTSRIPLQRSVRGTKPSIYFLWHGEGFFCKLQNAFEVKKKKSPEKTGFNFFYTSLCIQLNF